MRNRPHPAGAGLVAAAAAMALALVPLTAANAGLSQRAKVIKVIDGDTFDVDTDGDKKADARVRLAGIDTPEIGTCGSGKAKDALTSLLLGKWVTLLSDGDGATGVRGRLIRRATLTVDGSTVDAAEWMLERGYGPWRPYPSETSRWLQEHEAAASAAAAGLRYFDPNRCAPGPGPARALRMQVQWHADKMPGVDPLYEEFVRITNTSAGSIDLDYWPLRTGNMRGLAVPPGKPLEPGSTLTIHVGSGNDTRYHRFLDRSGFLFPDTSLDGGPHVGEGVYLLDRGGDLRAHQTWPCVGSCSDPTGGDLQIVDVQYDPEGADSEHVNGEWILLKNRGQSAVHTGNLVLDVRPIIYEFPPNHWLAPGGEVLIHLGRGTDTHDERYLRSGVDRLRNAGDWVLVRTFDAIVVDCVDWGDQVQSCPS